jgi:hypothetical protein
MAAPGFDAELGAAVVTVRAPRTTSTSTSGRQTMGITELSVRNENYCETIERIEEILGSMTDRIEATEQIRQAIHNAAATQLRASHSGNLVIDQSSVTFTHDHYRACIQIVRRLHSDVPQARELGCEVSI